DVLKSYCFCSLCNARCLSRVLLSVLTVVANSKASIILSLHSHSSSSKIEFATTVKLRQNRVCCQIVSIFYSREGFEKGTSKACLCKAFLTNRTIYILTDL